MSRPRASLSGGPLKEQWKLDYLYQRVYLEKSHGHSIARVAKLFPLHSTSEIEHAVAPGRRRLRQAVFAFVAGLTILALVYLSGSVA